MPGYLNYPDLIKYIDQNDTYIVLNNQVLHQK